MTCRPIVRPSLDTCLELPLPPYDVDCSDSFVLSCVWRVCVCVFACAAREVGRYIGAISRIVNHGPLGGPVAAAAGQRLDQARLLNEKKKKR